MDIDVGPYVENVRRYTAELKRRNAEATAKARAELPRIIEVLRVTPGLKVAYLFGSLAKDMFHPAADIDIAVEGVAPVLESDLRRRLEAVSSFPVDLVCFEDVLPPFRRLVEYYGEVLYAQPE